MVWLSFMCKHITHSTKVNVQKSWRRNSPIFCPFTILSKICQKKDSKDRYRIPGSYSVVPPVRNNIGKIGTWMKQKVIPPFFKGNVQAMIINIDPEIRRIIGHQNRPIEWVRECMCLQGFANKNVYISSHNLWRTAVCRIIKGLAFYSSKRPILRVIGGAEGVVPHPYKGGSK